MFKTAEVNTPKTDVVNAEVARLEAVVDEFAALMKARLAVKVGEGRTGWDDPANAEGIYNCLLANAAGVRLASGQEVDIANFAMFLWFISIRSGARA